MKSLLGVIAAAALILALGLAALTLFDTSPRIDTAQKTADAAQTSASAAMTRANEAQATAGAAYGLAGMANSKAEAALAAIQRGDSVAIVAIVIGGVVVSLGFGLFAFLFFASWDRSEQRRQEWRILQLRAGACGALPVPQPYYDLETNDYAMLELPPGKR